ncbi:polysaccharide biosynthesis C-terminal domain-containing protein [Rothia sp. LK2588]|uniref:lipopolysaccharide biosynthesis protein n=1 Tax=Rothia sp. LK2588 TaxID=3114369 RepID=UPI0034CDD02F
MPSLAKSGAISSVFVIYGAAAAFVATLIVTNGLGKSASGEFFQVMALFAIGTSLSVFGADTGLVRTVSAQRAMGRFSAVRQLVRFAAIPSLCLSIGITVVALIYTLPGVSPQLSDNYRVAFNVSAPFLIAAAVMTLSFGVLRGLHKVVTFTALQNVLLPTLRIAAVLLVVAFAGNMLSLALAWTIPVVVVALVAIVLVKRGMPKASDELVADAGPAETAKSFWGFSAARGVSAVVEAILEWIDVLAVALFLGAASSGMYGAVNRMVRMGVMVDHIGRVVTGPSISAAIATGKLDRARSIFVGNTRALIAVGWPFYITLAFFGPTLMEVFGHGFAQAAGVLWVICPAMMLQMAAGGVQSVLLMSGKSRWQLYNKLSSLAVSVALNLWLVPLWGLLGAVTAWAAAVLVDTLLAAFQVMRLVGIRAKPEEMIAVMVISAGVPLIGAFGVAQLMGQSWPAIFTYAAIVLPIYGLLMYRFREAIGIENLFKSRKKNNRSYSGKHFA